MRVFMIGALMGFAHLSWADDMPKPGLYHVTAVVSSAQMSTAGRGGHDHCLKDDQFSQDPNAWMQQQQPGQECEVVKYEVGGGEINMELSCSIPQMGPTTIIGTGTYTPTSFQMHNTTSMQMNGISMDISTEVNGRRTGDC